MFSHYIYKSQGSCNIILIIFPRLYNGLSNSLQSGKMNTGVNVFFVKNLVKGFPVQDICFIKFNRLACDLGTLSSAFSLELDRLSRTTTS